MSVVLEATYLGETFEVEVFHDGHIEFPGRDPEYDQAMAEFTGSESAVMKMWHAWKESPVTVILEWLGLSENSVISLMADYAEHVLHIYEDEYPEDFRPRNAITATRRFVAGEIDQQSLGKAGVAAEAAGAEAVASARAAAWMAWAATWAASYTVFELDWQELQQDSDADAEVAWQVRRFVDVMEAIGQGFDWPDMKVTP